jgi:hypothetical protein
VARRFARELGDDELEGLRSERPDPALRKVKPARAVPTIMLVPDGREVYCDRGVLLTIVDESKGRR